MRLKMEQKRSDSKQLYVGNLAYSVTWEELKDGLSDVGRIFHAKIATDRETKKSRGFGFITVAEKDVENFMAINGEEFYDRPIMIKEAREQQPRDRVKKQDA